MSLWNLSKDIKILGKPKRLFKFHDGPIISKEKADESVNEPKTENE
ncbi:MAG: hypothetical protein J6W18_09240 [Bacteroidaceae bacterium]|nr:hypothetical protein [Bacteroidaceae bacterium]MBR3937466.1 hypothetical protein [Bacteroidaceae bacterium]